MPDGAVFCSECGQILQQQETTQNASEFYWNDYKINADKVESERKALEAQLTEKRNKKRIIISVVAVGVVAFIVLYICAFKVAPAQSYNKAQKLFDDRQYSEAAQMFTELEDYGDSAAMVDLCQYNQAIEKYENSQYQAALSLFYPLIDYKDSRYYAGQCELQLLYASQINDTITLGNYQSTPIEWTVVSKNESNALLVSSYYIDMKIANESDKGENSQYNCWSKSTLRKWLNGEFVSSSFSPEVAALLLTNTIITNEYDIQNYDGWHETEITVITEDKVYIPSVADVETYELKPVSILGTNEDALVTGWLRDRGHGIAFQVSLKTDGSYGSAWHFSNSYGIRPIIRISLDGNISPGQSETSAQDPVNANEDNSSVIDTNSPFEQDYWVIFTEGFRENRVEAASMNSLLPSDSLYIVWDSSLHLNDTSCSGDGNQYFLDDNNEWLQIGTYSHFSDHATNILASNLDVYDSNGNLILQKCAYKDIDWNLINSYR